MLQHTDEKKPTGSTNYPAGHTDGAIVPAASSASKPPGTLLPLVVTACAAVLALRDALNTAMLRAWCVSPSALIRGRIRAKAKAPARKNTFEPAVATPTDKRGFVMSKFPGLVRLHRSRMVYGHGGGYPQGRPHGWFRVLNHHAHPLRVRTQRVVLKSRQGATTMSASPMASRRAAPTPTTSEQQAFAVLQATSDATMAKLYLSRGNIPAARRKAVQLLKALQVMEVAA